MPQLKFWLDINRGGVGLRGRAFNDEGQPIHMSKWLFHFSPEGNISSYRGADIGEYFNTNDNGQIIIQNFPEDFMSEIPDDLVFGTWQESWDRLYFRLDRIPLVESTVVRLICTIDSHIPQTILYLEPSEDGIIVWLHHYLHSPYNIFLDTYRGMPFVRY